MAELQGLECVASLLVEDLPAAQVDPSAAAKSDAQRFTESLGHLKQKARLTRNRDELMRVMMAADPSVVQNALLNPRLTEPMVVQMAAKRPATAGALAEIWNSPRWSSRHAVRRALVFNPYLPPEVGAKIIPLLNASDLKELSTTPSVHRALRQQAEGLLRRAAPAHGARQQ